MVYIAGNFEADEILCNVPPHTLRIDLQARRWKSDVDSESAITDSNDNGIPIEFVLLGFSPFFGNLGMRNGEEFLRIAYIGVTPQHRLLPPRCVTTTIVSGKSSQKNFISYFQNLYNNRINCASVITSTKFVTKSFSERDPNTGQDGAKINYNALEFKDRPATTPEEKKLLADVNEWLKDKGGEMLPAALRSHIPGSNLVELPLGTDHAAIKKAFVEANPPTGSAPSLAGMGDIPRLASANTEPPQATAKKTRTIEVDEDRAKELGIDF